MPVSGIAAVCGSAVAGATVATSTKRTHDAKRVALDLDLLLILILGAPLNHAGRNRQGWICTRYNGVDCEAAFAGKPAPTI
ncbi:hypothetical protein C1X27_25740 [Pseudomonas sp. MPR-AND1B]|nr:hypothetical protein C1X26_25490 [Pseudomonas sp. MPR-R3A]PMY95414.1 hypothetical protein C1X24_25475 [Pseudomonas sp. FW305-124]PMZ67913.1 hypothetical protein C1X25_25665 [Pseudomonas sp. GW247-3R2A]PNA87417.1 hypothetical protein C1X23_25715 [Pseudomonas sp. FW300-E2]PNA95908.1 hypothetical protein C1X27_25740 [Pseudomonas sp. MPR-AND1B]